METLKLIVSKPCPFAGVNFDDQQDVINRALKEGHIVCTIFYFHGELDQILGYDIGACLNAEYCTHDDLYFPGIYNAEINGIECTAYLWNRDNKPYGLIVKSDNEKDKKYAFSRYKIKDNLL